MLLAFALLPRAPRSAGAVLALAAALKLTPAVFVLLLLRRSTRPALAAFLLTGAALALASVALMGWPLHRAFLEQLARAAQSTVWAPMNPSPRALVTAGAAALGLAPPIPFENALLAILTPPAWIGRLAALSAAALALLTLRLAARAPEREGTALALLAVEIILFLLGPLSWLHYLIAPLLLLPALGLGLPRRLTLPMLGLALGLGSNLCLALVMRGPAPLLSYSLLTVALWAGLLALALLALTRVARGR